MFRSGAQNPVSRRERFRRIKFICEKLHLKAMARQLTSLTVFVASPGDVADERMRLEEVIRELNVTWSRQLGVHVDLVKWETHAFPDFGDGPQDVINTQVPGDYDIFIGIMWCRFGTPTNRAESGTAEEFARAKERYDRDPSSVKLMCYFKDSPVTPSKLDLEQLAKVTSFRQSIGDEGGLYWTFSGIDQFEKLIRLHLARQIQTYLNQERTALRKSIDDGSVGTVRTAQREIIEEDDEGVLDLMDVFEDRLEEMTSVSARIAKATEELGVQLTARSAEINDAKDKGDIPRNAAKRLIAKAASDMDQYVARMEAELPAFSKSVSEGLNALVKAMTLSIDTDAQNASDDEISSAMDAVEQMKNGIKDSHDSISGFREVVIGLPRLTSVLNESKRGVADVLDRLRVEFKTADSLANEARSVIQQVAAKRQCGK